MRKQKQRLGQKIVSALAAVALCFGMVPAAAFAEVAPEGASSTTVYVTISDKGTMELVRDAVQVTDVNSNGKLDIYDALSIAHTQNDMEGGFEVLSQGEINMITKLWGVSTSSLGYRLNNSLPSSIMTEVTNGDELYAYIYADQTKWTDQYLSFGSTSAQTAPDMPLALNLTSAPASWNPGGQGQPAATIAYAVGSIDTAYRGQTVYVPVTVASEFTKRCYQPSLTFSANENNPSVLTLGTVKRGSGMSESSWALYSEGTKNPGSIRYDYAGGWTGTGAALPASGEFCVLPVTIPADAAPGTYTIDIAGASFEWYYYDDVKSSDYSVEKTSGTITVVEGEAPVEPQEGNVIDFGTYTAAPGETVRVTVKLGSGLPADCTIDSFDLRFGPYDFTYGEPSPDDFCYCVYEGSDNLYTLEPVAYKGDELFSFDVTIPEGTAAGVYSFEPKNGAANAGAIVDGSGSTLRDLGEAEILGSITVTSAAGTSSVEDEGLATLSAEEAPVVESALIALSDDEPQPLAGARITAYDAATMDALDVEDYTVADKGNGAYEVSFAEKGSYVVIAKAATGYSTPAYCSVTVGDPYAASIEAPESFVQVGATFQVPVTMAAFGSLACGEGSFTYDATALELVSVAKGAGLSGEDLSFLPAENAAEAHFSFYNNEAAAQDGIVVVVATFKALKPGVSSVAVAGIMAGSAGDPTEHVVAAEPISVRVAAATLGDVNANGKINIVDAQCTYDLATNKYGTDYSKFPLAEGWNVDVLFYVANVSGDDAIDSADAFAIQRYVHYGKFGE